MTPRFHTRRSARKITTVVSTVFALTATVGFLRDAAISANKPSYPRLSTLMRVDSLQAFSPAEQVVQEHPVVLCFLCGCDNCRQSAKRLASLSHRLNPNVFGVFSIGPQDTKNFVSTTKFPGTPLLDTNSVVAESYDAATCPRVFVLQGQKILYHNSEGGRPLTEKELHQIAKYL